MLIATVLRLLAKILYKERKYYDDGFRLLMPLASYAANGRIDIVRMAPDRN